MLFKVRGIDVKQVYTHSVCSREYTFPGSSNDRGSFSVILVDFSPYFSVFLFLFSYFSLFFHCVFSSWLLSFFRISSCVSAIICIPLCFGRPETLNHCQQTATTSSIFRSFFFFPLFLITFRFPSTLLLVFRCSAYILASFISFPFTTVHCSTLHSLVFHRCVTDFSSILCTLLRLSWMELRSVRILLQYCRRIRIYWNLIFDMRYSFVSTYLDKSHWPLFTRENFVKTYCQVISCYRNRLAIWSPAYARVFPFCS